MNISKKILFYFLLLYQGQFLPHLTDLVSLVDDITTTDDLHSALQSLNPTIIKLYSQNCPYCTMLSKTFEDLAIKHRSITFMSADGKKLNAPKIISDFTKNTIKIPGYPSVLYIKKGIIVDHQIGGNPKVLEEKIQKLKK